MAISLFVISPFHEFYFDKVKLTEEEFFERLDQHLTEDKRKKTPKCLIIEYESVEENEVDQYVFSNQILKQSIFKVRTLKEEKESEKEDKKSTLTVLPFKSRGPFARDKETDDSGESE